MNLTCNLSDEIRQLILSVDTTKPQGNALHNDWLFLQESEERFIDFMKDEKLPPTGNIEYGPALYLLHQLPDWTVEFLKFLGMPATQIKKEDWDNWYTVVKNGPGVVADDGTLYLEQSYAQLDFGWTESLLYYLYYRWRKTHDAIFGVTPVITPITGQNTLSIAIMGDWGTGPYNDNGYPSPSHLVGQAISALSPKPDITLHLGDVYYAGRPTEETDKLLTAPFPASKLNFTLNSNHEMYDGANGYFNVALANALFQKTQNKTSYFAVTFGNWVIVGLDTAYYDSSAMYMDGAMYDNNQVNFIKSLKISASQKIILMTHHTGITANGTALTPPTYDGTTVKKPLFTQIVNAFGGRCPDYWYYGHIHNGIVYNDLSVTGQYKCPSGLSPKLRCVGHAAIPFGKGTGLFTGNKNNANISYFSQTPVPQPTPSTPFLGLRVLNGFAVITLTPTMLTEQFYEVSPTQGTIKVWNA